MEYIVTDKNVTITERRHLKGNENFPCMWKRARLCDVLHRRMPCARQTEREGNRMNILYCASEAAPFAASGGLGDVAGSLPKAIQNAAQPAAWCCRCMAICGKNTAASSLILPFQCARGLAATSIAACSELEAGSIKRVLPSKLTSSPRAITAWILWRMTGIGRADAHLLEYDGC